MSNFGSFQTSLSLGVEQGLQKLPKFDINDLKLLIHCYILIPKKYPRKTPFKTHWPPPPDFQVFYGPDMHAWKLDGDEKKIPPTVIRFTQFTTKKGEASLDLFFLF